MSGDPRAAFVDGVDTTKPNPVHPPKDTGVHGVGTGDPRAAWQSNSTVDSAALQEERDLKRAVSFCLTVVHSAVTHKFCHERLCRVLHTVCTPHCGLWHRLAS